MTPRKLLDYAIAALAGAMAVQVNEYLDTQYTLIVVLTPPFVAVLTFFILHKVEGMFLNTNLRVRKWLIPIAELEGFWINYSEIKGQKRYGIIDLYYDKEENKHRVRGWSFIESGKQVAWWFSQPVIFDPTSLSLEYRFNGESERKKKTKSGDRVETFNIEGWTTMRFNTPNRDDGDGRFINFHPTPIEHKFKLERLTDNVITGLLKKFPKDSDIEKSLKSKEFYSGIA